MWGLVHGRDATGCGWSGVGGILPFLQLTPMTCKYLRCKTLPRARLGSTGISLGFKVPEIPCAEKSQKPLSHSFREFFFFAVLTVWAGSRGCYRLVWSCLLFLCFLEIESYEYIRAHCATLLPRGFRFSFFILCLGFRLIYVSDLFGRRPCNECVGVFGVLCQILRQVLARSLLFLRASCNTWLSTSAFRMCAALADCWREPPVKDIKMTKFGTKVRKLGETWFGCGSWNVAWSMSTRHVWSLCSLHCFFLQISTLDTQVTLHVFHAVVTWGTYKAVVWQPSCSNSSWPLRIWPASTRMFSNL